MNLKNVKVFTSKFVGTGPFSYEKRIYRATVSQSLRNTVLDKRPRYNRDKAICVEYYDEADMVLKVNSTFGENVTRTISDNKHTELGGGGVETQDV